MMALLLLLMGVATTLANEALNITHTWNGGYEGDFTIYPDRVVHNWRCHVIFDSSVDVFEVYKGTLVSNVSDTEFVMENYSWDADLQPGQPLVCHFVVRSPGNLAIPGSFYCVGLDDDGNETDVFTLQHELDQTTPPPIKVSGGSTMKYDYPQALNLSILFYDAQRSGKLPANNPIPWRSDSAVNDSDNGHDLSGGWYDAGDHIKFTFPMATSTWILNWGFLQFSEAYEHAGLKDEMCASVKWPLDYFLKAWIPDEQTLYVQVGAGDLDHNYWGSPELMTMDRPAFKVNAQCGGSDVSGATAAALASGYMVFNNICGDSDYADRLLNASMSLFEFGMDHKQFYSKCIDESQDFYGSGSYRDDMAVAAAFLYKATGDRMYLGDAITLHQDGIPWSFSWGDTMVAANLLLYDEADDNSTYRRDVEAFVRSFMPGGSVPETPCGMAYRNQWGSNRFAANAAFIAIMAADMGINTYEFRKWGISQINYLLGDNKYHMSYEIGFGDSYPSSYHHRASSCTMTNTNCTITAPGPNPNILLGGLVGGPDENDNWADLRGDYVKNEVACDYNAGFQSALAGLAQSAMHGEMPEPPPAKC